MPLFGELFPQRSKRFRNAEAHGRSGGPGVCILPSIPEGPALQGPSRYPTTTRSGPFRCRLPLRKVFSPTSASGSKAVMDSFIYENWRVHPRGPTPRRAFEDDRRDSSGEPGGWKSLSKKPAKRSISREGPGNQRRGIRGKRCGGGSSAVIKGGLSKGRKKEGGALTEPGNEMKSLNFHDFYKRCKIRCWTKVNGSRIFKT